MRVRLVIRLRVRPSPGWQHFFMEIDHEIFSKVILSLQLIQEGQFSVSCERMCRILVNHLEDYACPVRVWLGKLTTLHMTPLGWLGCKTLLQTNSSELLGIGWQNFDTHLITGGGKLIALHYFAFFFHLSLWKIYISCVAVSWSQWHCLCVTQLPCSIKNLNSE